MKKTPTNRRKTRSRSSRKRKNESKLENERDKKIRKVTPIVKTTPQKPKQTVKKKIINFPTVAVNQNKPVTPTKPQKQEILKKVPLVSVNIHELVQGCSYEFVGMVLAKREYKNDSQSKKKFHFYTVTLVDSLGRRIALKINEKQKEVATEIEVGNTYKFSMCYVVLEREKFSINKPFNVGFIPSNSQKFVVVIAEVPIFVKEYQFFKDIPIDISIVVSLKGLIRICKIYDLPRLKEKNMSRVELILKDKKIVHLKVKNCSLKPGNCALFCRFLKVKPSLFVHLNDISYFQQNIDFDKQDYLNQSPAAGTRLVSPVIFADLDEFKAYSTCVASVIVKVFKFQWLFSSGNKCVVVKENDSYKFLSLNISFAGKEKEKVYKNRKYKESFKINVHLPSNLVEKLFASENKEKIFKEKDYQIEIFKCIIGKEVRIIVVKKLNVTYEALDLFL